MAKSISPGLQTWQTKVNMRWQFTHNCIAVWEQLCMERGWSMSKYISHMQATIRCSLTGQH